MNLCYVHECKQVGHVTWGEEEKPVYGAAGRSGFRWYLVARLDSVGAWSLVSMDSAGEE